MGKKICIDAGHGGHDAGAVGLIYKEKDINLLYALALSKELTGRGHSVTMTRSSDSYVTISKRSEISNSAGCSAFVSIHVNSDEKKAGKGYEVLYNPQKGEALAKYVDSEIAKNKSIWQQRRGLVKRTNLGVLNATSAPCCLVELGFIHNQTDMKFVNSNVAAYVKAIADGIEAFFNSTPLIVAPEVEQNTTDANGFTSKQVVGDNQGLPPIYGVGNTDTSNQSTSNPLISSYKPSAVPPSYYNDVLPEHRDTQSKFFLRIGDCQFFIPPLFINVTDNTKVASIATIRQREGVKIGTGYSNKTVTITIWFDGMEHINGTPVSGPAGQTYYMDGLRSLIAQLKKSPFLPVTNELLNEVHKIYALTLLDANYSTVPEMPGCVQATLTFKEFNAQPYIGMPTVCLDSMFCWPLFRWFYQQQLVDEASFSKFKLPTINTDDFVGTLKFKVLPENILKNAEPISSNGNTDKRYSYISHEWAFMEEVDMAYDDVVVKSINVSLGHIVTDIQLALHASPTHQFLGSLDTMFTIVMSSKSREFCKQLVELNQTVQGYSRSYKNKIVTGYLGIENEFINMFGVETVCITKLDVSTKEGFPDEFEIVLTCISYNKTQKEQEKPNGMAPHNVLDESDLLIGKTAENYKTPIVIDGVIEDMIKDLELYPDLQLPTYHVVNEFIKKLNDYRSGKGLMSIGIDSLNSPCERSPYSTDIFVDPDFYMFYPSPRQLGIISEEDMVKFYETYKSSDSNGMLDKNLKFSDGQTLVEATYQIIRNCKELGKDMTVPLSYAENKSTQDMPSIPDKEYYKLMFHDMFAYSKRYTMCRAFPTALFIFIDEGRNVRGTRMWNNFYSYHSMIEVNIHKDKDNPVNVCELTLSNVYYSLSTKPSYTDAKRKNVIETFFLSIDEEMTSARKRMYEFMNIEPGCRIHVRIGYGSYGTDLPIVFNGQIAEIDSSDIMTIIAQSDGGELLNPIPASGEDSTGVFKYGSEASTVIRNIMCERESWLSAYNWVDNTPLGDTVNNSKYGIEHFGSVYYKNSGQGVHLKALFHIGDQDRFSYDVTKNIYRGLPFVEESGGLRRTTTDQWTWQAPFGEYNSYIYLYGKTSWDVFKVFAAANIDYIAGIAEHNFRSTLFFGQPSWLYKYGTEYVGASDQESRLNINNYNEKVKTYMQAHCIDSLMDIVDNSTRLSSQGLCTCVIPIYTEGESTKTDMMIYADRNLYPEYLRTEYYDTTSMQDFWLWEPLYTVMGNTQARDTARCMGISYLQHSFRDMYQGQLTILGDASINPNDLLFLNDSYRKMYGPSYVGSVTHMLSIDSGFVTTIKQDLISTTHMSFSVTHGRMLAMANLFAFNFNIATTAITLTSDAMKAVQMFETNNLLTTKRSGDSNHVLANIAGGLAVVGFTVFTGGTGFLAIAGAMAVGWSATDASIEWFRKVFQGKDANTIALMPLTLDDKPFVTGIKGQQTLLPGYTDTSTIGDLLQDQSIDGLTFQSSIQSLMNDKNAVYEGIAKRKSTGIDIFNLELDAVEAGEQNLMVLGATQDRQLFVSESSASELASIVYGGSYGTTTSSSARNTIVSSALGKVGSDYVSGQEGQLGSNGKYQFDCSGLVYWTYNQAGVKISRETANTYYTMCDVISYNDLSPGDLVFNNKKSDGKWGHVMIYIGDGKIVHASNSKVGVIESKVPTGSGVAYGRLKALAKSDQTSSNTGASKGTIDGKSYVHSFPKAICTCYSDTGASASGEYVTANGTVCAAHNLPVGTIVYIPSLKSINGTGEFKVADTGGPYFDFDINTTKSIGKGAHDAYILSWGTGRVMYSFESAIAEQQKLGKWNSLRSAYDNYKGQFVTENFKYKG